MPTITYNVPAEKAAEFADSLRWKFDMPGATIPQLQAALDAYVKRQIKGIYVQHKNYLHRETPIDLSLD